MAARSSAASQRCSQHVQRSHATRRSAARCSARVDRRGALAGAAAALFGASRPAAALSIQDARGFAVCGDVSDVPPQNYTNQARENANKVRKRREAVRPGPTARNISSTSPARAEAKRLSVYCSPSLTLSPLHCASSSPPSKVFLSWLIKRVDEELTDVKWQDAVRLAVMDAGTGAMDGSIRFELDRPYAAGLKEVAEKYERAKKAIDAELLVPLGYGDLYALAPKVLMNRQWREDFAGRTDRFPKSRSYKKGAYEGSLDDEAFLSAFYKLYGAVDFKTGTPILLGRDDATEAADGSLIPGEGADAKAYKDWFATLGIKVGALAPLAECFDTSGAALEALKTDGGFGGVGSFVERNERDAANPGLVEKRIIYAFSDAMTLGTNAVGRVQFNEDKYMVPAYVDGGVGWAAVPPFKEGLDFGEIFPAFESAPCVLRSN